MIKTEILSTWFNGDQDAVNFALCLWEASQEWDDLEDEGKCSDHNRLLTWLSVGMHLHPFMARNGGTMRPILLSMILQWRAANVLERGDDADIEKAYMLRACYYPVLHAMAYLTGGDDHATAVGPEIYRTYGERMDDLKAEFANG